MTPDAILNSRAKQVQAMLDNGYLSGDAVLKVDEHAPLNIRGIYKKGYVSTDLGTKLKRDGAKHWFDLCPLSLPDWANSASALVNQSLVVEGKEFRIVTVSESFATLCLTLQPVGGI